MYNDESRKRIEFWLHVLCPVMLITKCHSRSVMILISMSDTKILFILRRKVNQGSLIQTTQWFPPDTQDHEDFRLKNIWQLPDDGLQLLFVEQI